MVGGPGERAERRVVYSTDHGRICPSCGRPAAQCACRQQPVPRKLDGTVRIYRDRRRRRGKMVTVIEGVAGDTAALAELAASLKRLCGTGGTVKDGVIEIQGDHRDAIAARLGELGHRVKLAGG